MNLFFFYFYIKTDVYCLRSYEQYTIFIVISKKSWTKFLYTTQKRRSAKWWKMLCCKIYKVINRQLNISAWCEHSMVRFYYLAMKDPYYACHRRKRDSNPLSYVIKWCSVKFNMESADNHKERPLLPTKNHVEWSWQRIRDRRQQNIVI